MISNNESNNISNKYSKYYTIKDGVFSITALPQKLPQDIKLLDVLNEITSTNSFSIKLEFRGMKYDRIVELADVLNDNKSIQSIDLKYCFIGHEGAEVLAKALEKNNSLKSIDLSCNNIKSKGAKFLADALKLNNSLQSINLISNDIGTKFLADVLNGNNSLQSINLSYNNVRNEGVENLAKALEKNNSLKSIGLKCNNVGNEGAKFLAEALKVNNSLRSINLMNNDIGNEGLVHLANALKMNTTLKSVGLDCSEEMLKDIMKVNVGIIHLPGHEYSEYIRIQIELNKAYRQIKKDIFENEMVDKKTINVLEHKELLIVKKMIQYIKANCEKYNEQEIVDLANVVYKTLNTFAENKNNIHNKLKAVKETLLKNSKTDESIISEVRQLKILESLEKKGALEKKSITKYSIQEKVFEFLTAKDLSKNFDSKDCTKTSEKHSAERSQHDTTSSLMGNEESNTDMI